MVKSRFNAQDLELGLRTYKVKFFCYQIILFLNGTFYFKDLLSVKIFFFFTLESNIEKKFFLKKINHSEAEWWKLGMFLKSKVLLLK